MTRSATRSSRGPEPGRAAQPVPHRGRAHPCAVVQLRERLAPRGPHRDAGRPAIRRRSRGVHVHPRRSQPGRAAQPVPHRGWSHPCAVVQLRERLAPRGPHRDARGPAAVGDPVAYTFIHEDRNLAEQHNLFRTGDGHIHALWFNFESGWHHEDRTAMLGAPASVGDPVAYTFTQKVATSPSSTTCSAPGTVTSTRYGSTSRAAGTTRTGACKHTPNARRADADAASPVTKCDAVPHRKVSTWVPGASAPAAIAVMPTSESILRSVPAPHAVLALALASVIVVAIPGTERAVRDRQIAVPRASCRVAERVREMSSALFHSSPLSHSAWDLLSRTRSSCSPS